ncbi:reverse transcriptase-like protein [Salibacterium halotolerans]|uniref:Ribonuclease HI n=1 Tax=Salibacterium halotolerans TaxID=1884432 RepID=A0A1I5URP6_9BACI|nr:reverse transcriptase-like protein [Salibacterium halotolerans]SFP97974.1 ribonuclease HI [Salibacterium halotolerans]
MIKLFIDGASAGNPGPAGAGIFVVNPEGNDEHHAVPLEMMSNHEAEFAALREALKLCVEREWAGVSIHTDSQLVDEAVEKQYTKHPLYRPRLEEVLTLFAQCSLCFIKWIPSTRNRTADQLSKKAVRMNKSSS